ncbi:MAG: hypothetical protein ABJA34_11950 [Pseudonocardiales bacterium]
MSLLDRLRPDRPPAEVIGAIEPGDRMLSWAVPTAGGYAAASRLGLRLPEGRLLAWHTIDKVTWRAGEMIITESTEVSPGVREALPVLVLSLAEPRDLPAVVRARVTRSIAYTTRHIVHGAHVRIVARRMPGLDGLAWSLRFDNVADRDDAAVRAAADQLMAGIRSDLTL